MESATLRLDYVPRLALDAQSASWWEQVLGVVGFDRPPTIGHRDVPVTASMTPALGDAVSLCEVWRVTGTRDAPASGSVESHGRTRYRHRDGWLFGSITLDERALGDSSTGLRRATLTAYQQLFAALRETAHPHLVRVWNYLPEINRESVGEERYRIFNSARRCAFVDSGRDTEGTVPAASALGSPADSPLSIYFLAARRGAWMIENPRQTSAYHYPRKFGVHSPIFSRACLLDQTVGTNLFISGTASIVGHETLHPGDVKAQTHETMRNIDALMGEANRLVGAARYSLDQLNLKVYVRDPTDLNAIESALRSRLSAPASIVFLRADVCRSDLLVEIEATGDSTRS